jgi:hypothetical protein
VVASASLVAEGVAVEVEQRDEDRDDADRVDRDESCSEDGVSLVRVGVAVDGEAVRTVSILDLARHILAGVFCWLTHFD